MLKQQPNSLGKRCWPLHSRNLLSRQRSTSHQPASSNSSASHRQATTAAAAQPSAVITGCSTGIGRDTALMLAENVSLLFVYFLTCTSTEAV
jgi:hypothetical protein